MFGVKSDENATTTTTATKKANANYQQAVKDDLRLSFEHESDLFMNSFTRMRVFFFILTAGVRYGDMLIIDLPDGDNCCRLRAGKSRTRQI